MWDASGLAVMAAVITLAGCAADIGASTPPDRTRGPGPIPDPGPEPMPRPDDGDPSSGFGVGMDSGFDTSRDESEGVSVSPDDGALILDSRRVDTAFIWIANTGEGTVSKVDTRTYLEVARYRTGPDGAGNDPSRTSVNGDGDVFVGNRAGQSLTKISVLGAGCPDSNGDGVVTTSASAGDVLDWGRDDCVLWNTALEGGGIIRAVAAQDIDALDGIRLPYVWAGGWDGVVWKLDGNTGAILIRTPSPVQPYGFALDGRGNLWISGRNANALGRLDTNRCVDDATCLEMTCRDTGAGEGDACVKARIAIPNGLDPYGITVDALQRVWVAAHGSRSVGRYDHGAPGGARWVTTNVGEDCHGIAADGAGWVWCAAQGSGVVRVNADNPTQNTLVNGTEGYSVKGMAVDFDGKIWAITRGTNAVVIAPGAGLLDSAVTTGVAEGLVSPYTYSDMTGQQLRLATDPRGHYRAVVEACDEETTGGTEWHLLHWDADTPPGTRLIWRVRTAATREGLAAAAWLTIAETPPDVSPADIQAALAAASIEHERYLEIEVQLHAMRSSSTESITPRVYSFEATWICRPFLG